MSSRERFAQRRDDILKAKLLSHSGENTLVTGSVSLTTLYVSLRLEAQTEFSVLLITDANIDILHQGAHDRLSLLLSPEFLTEVEVNRHRYTVALSSFASQLGEFGCLIRDSRRNTRPVEPVSTFHDSVEIEILGVSLGNRRVSTVVNHLAGAHRSTSLQVVNTYTVATASDKVCLHTKLTQGIDSRLTNFVLRQLTYKVSVVTIVCAANSYVGLATTINHVKRI